MVRHAVGRRSRLESSHSVSCWVEAGAYPALRLSVEHTCAQSLGTVLTHIACRLSNQAAQGQVPSWLLPPQRVPSGRRWVAPACAGAQISQMRCLQAAADTTARCLPAVCQPCSLLVDSQPTEGLAAFHHRQADPSGRTGVLLWLSKQRPVGTSSLLYSQLPS
jgi:hypothetical protein